MKDPRDFHPELAFTLVVRTRKRESRADRVVASGFPSLEEAISAAQEAPLFSGESAVVEDETGFAVYQRVGNA